MMKKLFYVNYLLLIIAMLLGIILLYSYNNIKYDFELDNVLYFNEQTHSQSPVYLGYFKHGNKKIYFQQYVDINNSIYLKFNNKRFGLPTRTFILSTVYLSNGYFVIISSDTNNNIICYILDSNFDVIEVLHGRNGSQDFYCSKDSVIFETFNIEDSSKKLFYRITVHNDDLIIDKVYKI